MRTAHEKQKQQNVPAVNSKTPGQRRVRKDMWLMWSTTHFLPCMKRQKSNEEYQAASMQKDKANRVKQLVHIVRMIKELQCQIRSISTDFVG